MHRTPAQLMYFISDTQFLGDNYSVLIVSFVGPFTREGVAILEECGRNILDSPIAKFVIFNFRDVPSGVDPTCLVAFKNLQSRIRSKPATVRFSSVHPELRPILLENNCAYQDEIVNNLAEACEIIPVMRSAA